jgi:GDP-L-fucose synthase
MYVEDCAELILWSLMYYDPSDQNSIILAPDESDEISIFNAVHKIVDCLYPIMCEKYKMYDAFEIHYSFNGMSDGQYKKTSSNKKLRSLLPTYKFTPFDEGIKKTILWYIDNINDHNKFTTMRM